MMGTLTEKKEKSILENIIQSPYKIILHNDDYNTFDWVIECLVKICGHDLEQATQCAHIVHFKGKCDVKYGDLNKLKRMKDTLHSSGLNVTLEEN